MDNLYGITIPTVLPDRSTCLIAVLCQLAAICPDVPVAVSAHLDDAPRGRDTIEALKRGASFGCEWTVYLEDDSYLAPVFDSVVRARLREAQDLGLPVVSFYSDNRRVLRAMAEGDQSCLLPARFLWATVCVAVRSHDVARIEAFAPGWYAAHPEHWHASDLLLRDFFAADGQSALLAVPSPVQHRDEPTMLRHGTRRRRYSRSFSAAYGQVRPLENV